MPTAPIVRGRAATRTALGGDGPTVRIRDLHQHARTVTVVDRRNSPPRAAEGVVGRASVGDRFGGGQLSGGMRDDGTIWVNAFVGQGVTVDLDPAEAEAFAVWLAQAANQAR